MGIRRSLRLQSRIEPTVENLKKTVKKSKLPRKLKVKVKKNVKPEKKNSPRRSSRIRKRNSFYPSKEGQKHKDLQESLVVNNLQIASCEVKLEHIDLLIEKLNLETQESNSIQNEKPLKTENVDNADIIKNKDIAFSESEGLVEEQKENSPTDENTLENADVGVQLEKENSEQEEIAKHMMEMLSQYKIQNEIDFDEINSISNDHNEEKVINYSWGTENQQNWNSEKIIKNVFFNNTNVYNFKSCFKDRASLTAAFDRHSGQVSNETYPYDINETPEAEKVKRFYRKNISDPNLHSWYQYNVVSSRRFSKQDPDEIITTKPYMEKYLVY